MKTYSIDETDLVLLADISGGFNSSRVGKPVTPRWDTSVNWAKADRLSDLVNRLKAPEEEQPAPPAPPSGALWAGTRAPIVDWPGRFFDAAFDEAVCYSYRFVVPQPPYIDASPIVRGSVAIQPDFRATLVCKVSETPYDIDGWQGEQGPGNGAWDDIYGWDPSFAGKTLYLNFAIGRGFGARTLRVEVFAPTHGVRDANT